MKKYVTIRSYYRDVADYQEKFIQFFAKKGFEAKLISHEKKNIKAAHGQSRDTLELVFEMGHDSWDDRRFEFYYDMFRSKILVLNSSFDYIVEIK